jgi:2-polyprenyl-3-methyl-5-hydroxy-6-metoxy-1,4-benzoquinol methylase
MHYDPIKNVFASLIKKYSFIRIVFYNLLDLFFLRSWYVRRELKKIRKTFHDNTIEIYDAGTGFGQYTYFMSKKLSPANILSVDIKEDWIKDAEKFFGKTDTSNVKLKVEDLLRINHENKFDLILCVDVMEHITEDVQVFQNFYRALKPNGFLLINSPSIFGGSDVHSDEDESFIDEHARVGYSKEELESKLHPLGFKTYKSQYTYGFWGDKAWRLGIKYPMVLLNISKIFFIVLPIYYLFTSPFTFILMILDYNSNNKIGSGINFIAQK